MVGLKEQEIFPKNIILLCEYNYLATVLQKVTDTDIHRAVARSENPGGLVVLGGDNVSPLVETGLTDLPKTGGAPLLATALIET